MEHSLHENVLASSARFLRFVKGKKRTRNSGSQSICECFVREIFNVKTPPVYTIIPEALHEIIQPLNWETMENVRTRQ